MLAAVGIVFLRVEFEPHPRRYVNYIVPSNGDEGADQRADYYERDEAVLIRFCKEKARRGRARGFEP
jgi:hypothetical protein